MIIKKFEDCIAWQKAGQLTLKIYKLFEKSRDFGFRDQIQRASVSIMNNIAEGFDRNSDNEFKQFLFIARGSNAEVRSMLYIAVKLGYISQEDFKKLYSLTTEIGKTITGLIKSLK